MRTLTSLAVIALAAAGFLAASLQTPAAQAWDVNALPAGYGVSSFQTVCHLATDPCVGGEGSVCNHFTVTAGNTGRQLAETDCVNPTFQADVDRFVDSTVCQVNPAAGGQLCATASTTAPATTTTVAVPPVTTTVPVQPPPDQPTTTTVTVTTPGYTDTVTVTVPAIPADLEARLTLTEQRLAVLEERTQALEDETGLILGELKNQPPFTNAV